MDSGPEYHSSVWSRIAKFFTRRDEEEFLEKAISEARADGTVQADEESMLLSILRFTSLQVQDIMTPRTDIDCISVESALPQVTQYLADSSHSRIPIYQETRDNIVGIVHARDLLRYLLDPAQHATPIEKIMRKPHFVPETMGVRELLQEFRSLKLHMAIVQDEYGGTSGLITFKDVLREIVGDIEDEHDAPREEDIRDLGDDHFELTGRAKLEDLEKIGVLLESDEVDTLGGYLCMLSGHVPCKGETFSLADKDFVIEEADAKTIRRIHMRPHQPN